MPKKSIVTLAAAFLTLSAAAQSTIQTKPSRHKAATPATHAPARPEEGLAPLNPQQRVIQTLNRFTFGPRPGEIDAANKIGADAWFERQLNPGSIPDSALENRLADFPSLYLPPPQLLVESPSLQVIRDTAGGKRPYPADPTLASMYEVLVTKYNHREADKKAEQVADSGATPPMGSAAAMTDQQKAQQRQDRQRQAQVLADQMLAYPREQRMVAILKLPVEQRITLTEFISEPRKSLLINDLNPRQKEIFAIMAGNADALRIVDAEFQQAKILRAVLSERQLLEVMTDFWYNHFNVDIRKESAQWYGPTYERDALRAHALGKFSDLLLATAQHPAMLAYLDNWSSIGPDSQAAGKPNKKQPQRGLNENYGREVMELHTVGVDGGYTQQDVTNLATILTGWTIDGPLQGGGFVFDPRKHQPGSVKWYGQTIPDKGYEAGRQALLWLAAQPQTAHFISYKLAQRFVADQPPPALVDRMAKTFLETGGDIKEVLRTLFHSPEFNSQKYYRNQVKTPLEFVASVLRATDTNPTNPTALTQVIARMGEPLYQEQPPTGYPSTADYWMNSGALVQRLNFSMQFAGGKVGGIKFDGAHLLAEGLLAMQSDSPAALRNTPRTQPVAMTTAATPSGQDEVLTLMEKTLIASQVSAKTNAVILHELTDPPPTSAAPAPVTPQAPSTPGQMQNQPQNPMPDQAQNQTPMQSPTQPRPKDDAAQTLATMTALILGSPEFQMH